MSFLFDKIKNVLYNMNVRVTSLIIRISCMICILHLE